MGAEVLQLAVDPMDMRAGADPLISGVVADFGSAQACHCSLFADARGTRVMRVLHDGSGVWCARRRLNQGGFTWPGNVGAPMLHPALTPAQHDAFMVCLLHGQ